MSKEEEKYLIALGNLQNMAIDNTKGSKAVEICTNDIRTYVERLNNIIDELEKTLKEEVKGLYNEENPMLLDETYIKYATERKMAYMYILDKLNELKGDNK